MRKVILATFTGGVLLTGTAVAFAECQSRVQARAANPNAHIAYRFVDGAHCWFAGFPVRRVAAVTEKKKLRLVRLSKSAKTETAKADVLPPAQAPLDLPNTRELETVAQPSDRAQHEQRIVAAFDAIQSDTNSVQGPPPRSLAPDANSAEVQAAEPAQPPRQRGPPAKSQGRYLKLVGWFLVIVGAGTVIAAVLIRYRGQWAGVLRSRTKLPEGVQRLHLRVHTRTRTPLIHHIETRIADPPIDR